MLLPVICSATTTAIKKMKITRYGGCTIPTVFASISAFHTRCTTGRPNSFMVKQVQSILPRTKKQEVILHKRQAHLGSQVECCFASPESERTAFACSKTSENLLTSLRNKSPLSTSTFKSSLGFPLRLVSIVGIVDFTTTFQSNNSFIKLRSFCTSSSCLISNTSKMASNGSLGRQNFHEDCEANINKQINMELYASYVYLSMAYYFDREDVALPGLSKFFKKASDEEREHAEKFMKYQNTRGGRIVLQPIAKPTRDEWQSPLEAVSAALELEKTVNQTLLDLHGISGSHNDPQLCDFLETNFLEEQVHAIKELSEYVAQLKRVGPGLGEHIFDRELLNKAD